MAEAQDERIPVYFVHGYNSAGAEHDLGAFMQAVDPKKYRVVPFDYDYTQRLDKTATELAERIRAEGKPAHVLAHSMGGLVALGATGKLKGTGKVSSLTTIATPYNGHKAASLGVYLAPFMGRPVWRDMVPGSDYQRAISAQDPGTAFNVFVADKDGRRKDDGAVSFESQTKRKVVARASRVVGFQNTHSGVLRDPAAVKQWVESLAPPPVTRVGE